MESYTETLIAGVVGGLITAGILWLLTSVWRDKFDPWLSDKRYRGIRIDGNWRLAKLSPDGTPTDLLQDETLEISQRAAKLAGRLILVSSPGEGVTRTLVLEGIIRDRFVLFTAVPASRQALGFAVFLGQVVGEGSELNGEVAYFDTAKNAICNLQVVYEKQLTS